MRMEPGIAKVGQRVRTLRKFAGWPNLAVGSFATVTEVVKQEPGAETDSLLIHVDQWPDDGSIVCQSQDVELVF